MEWTREFIFRHIKKFNNNFSNLIYPNLLEIQLTNICNLNCSFCNSKNIRKNNIKELNYDIILNFIRELKTKGLKAVTLEGGGEPSLYSKIEDLILEIKKLNIQCGIITNGIKKLSEKCCKNLNYIRISLDSYDKNSYISIKGKDYFDTVIENIKYYSKFRNSCLLGISYIIIDSNTNNIKNLLNSLENYIDYIQFKKEENNTKKEMINISSNKTNIYFIDCEKNKEEIYDNVCQKCYTNQLTSTIQANGNILFCKRMLNPIIIGNIYNNNISEIYKNNLKKIYVQKVLTKENFKNLCTKPCRLKKYNYEINKFLNFNKKTKWFF